MIVDDVSEKFLERKGSESIALKNDLLNERNDEANLEMKIQRVIFLIVKFFNNLNFYTL